MSDWAAILGLIKSGAIDPAQGAQFIETLLADLRQIGGGRDLTPDQVRALAALSLPVLGKILGQVAPGLKPEIFVTGLLLADSHRMTPEEEKAWMDRASGGPSSHG